MISLGQYMVNEITKKKLKIIVISKRTSILLTVVVNRFCVIERYVCIYDFNHLIMTNNLHVYFTTINYL